VNKKKFLIGCFFGVLFFVGQTYKLWYLTIVFIPILSAMFILDSFKKSNVVDKK